MAEKESAGAAAGGHVDAESRELLNADGQSARLVSNTTGEFSLDRAREGFERAGAEHDGEEREGGQSGGGTRD